MSGLPLNVLDMVVLVILLGSGVFALVRGFVHEVLSMAGWVGASFATLYGLPLLRPLVRQYISSATAADIAAGAVLFLGTLLVLSLITHAISRKVRTSSLSGVDRSLGFIFGVARGVVIVSLAYMLGTGLLATESLPSWFTEAKTKPVMVMGAEVIRKVLPEEFNRAETRAKSVGEDARKAADAARMFENLANPQPRADQPADPAANSGYGNSERRDMDRLIHNNQ